MDYEKKYNEALERGKEQLIACGDNEGRKRMIRKIFPELAESEDEGIRKQLIETIDSIENFPDKDTAIAWLEKRKEENIPKWRKADGKERFDERLVVLSSDNDLWVTNYAEKGEYYLPFTELTRLPKEG